MAPLYQTYELYLYAADGAAPQFEAFTCRSQDDVVPQAHRLIEERGLKSVEVRRLGRPLFTVTA